MSISFYDQLAPYYHLLYGDWEQAIARQGAALANLLDELGIARDDELLDAASGVGTQTLGLIAQGYKLTASDISSGAIDRLEVELAQRGLQARAQVDDMRNLSHAADLSFSAVLACDNSIPHLLSDDEILRAFQSCYRVIRPGGVAIFSVRDYANEQRKSPDVRPYGLRHDADGRFLAVQVWEWESDQYELRIYLTFEAADGTCETKVLRSRYYAISIARLMSLMARAGLVDVQRRDDVLFQPVLIGRRPI